MRNLIILFVLAALLLASCVIKEAEITEGTPLPTASPSRTPRPTFTPYISPTPFLTPGIRVYELPAWLQNSEDHVLMMSVWREETNVSWSGSFDQILFFDADNREQFRIDIANFEEAFWLDSQHIIFFHAGLCESFRYYSILDVSTGSISRHKAEEYQGDACSPQRPPYYVFVSRYDGENPPVTIFDTHQYTTEYFAPQTGQTRNLGAELSPDNQTLVILQSTEKSGDLGRFVIYDFPSREMLRSYEVKKPDQSFYFTADGNAIIYLEERTPCILRIDNLKRRCGNPVPDKYQRVVFQGVTRTNNIVFSHDMNPEVGYHDWGLCFFNMLNGQAQCPMDQLSALRLDEGMNALGVLNFSITNDEQYIAFTYGEGCPTCDYQYVTGMGVVDMNGTLLYNMADPTLTLFWRNPIWRPRP